MRATLRLILALFFLSPFLIWLVYVPHWALPPLADWGEPVLVATRQAGWSALLSLVVGGALCAGLQALIDSKLRWLAEIALLLPNMVPPLFLVMSLLSWFTPFRIFPYGLGAVIGAHVLINAGLAAIALDQLLRSRLGSLSEAAWLMGARPLRFWTRVGWPVLKFDLVYLFIFLFSVCFTSFSIPLMLGGQKQATLEVAIYDSIRLDGRWDTAVLMAAIQSALLLVVTMFLPKALLFRPQKTLQLRFFGMPTLRVLVFVPSLVLILGWLSGLKAASQLALPQDLPWVEALLSTAALGLSVGLLHLLLFLAVAMVTPHARLQRFLVGYLAPSAAITGFALLLLPGESWTFIKLVVALTLIFFPLLYRWIVHSSLLALENQVVAARYLGASWPTILLKVLWPQLCPQLLRASGLAAFWAAGDFAVTQIVAGGLTTVPTLMTALVDSYRVDAAQIFLLPLLLVGFALYGIFVGATRYVAG